MTVEYDLVAIGNTAAAVQGAIAASQRRARVALVMEEPEGIGWQEVGLRPSQVFARMAIAENPWAREQPLADAAGKVDALADAQLPSVLAMYGVDCILGRGRFCRLPELGFEVAGRRLRSRSYLLAPATHTQIPAIEGLEATQYFTCETVWQLTEGVFTQRLAIVGGDPSGIEVAQALARRGVEVTIAVSSDRLLPGEEPEIAHYFQASLEAAGIRVLTQMPVSQVKQIQGQLWVQAGDRAWETDAIYLATGQQADLHGLQLETIGVKYQRHLHLNRRLQTTNPRIYGCRGELGGYPHPQIACYEADIAIRNALSLPLVRTNYRAIPWVVGTDLQFATVGMSQAQAQQRYGNRAIAHCQILPARHQVQRMPSIPGKGKLILRRDGRLLGAHLTGTATGEMIHILAMAIQQGMTLRAIASLVPASNTFAELYRAVGEASAQYPIPPGSWIQAIWASMVRLW
ncbi:MAG: FAD-dependent oxidoreductase [Coleofasciculaceae cyanobacterium SM2_3_26]|nr:FAD-dependent oxidoreductase [Coleofasciculaceae cyanobacterium SM2_3_26]